MKINSEMIRKAEQVAEDLFYDYEMFAIRIQETPFQLGELDHVSHEWIDGEDTGDELDGVCCTEIDSYKHSSSFGEYFGEYAAVIAGNYYSWGEDAGEVIIRNPVVVAILQ